jgi:hypothetical protein
MKDWHQIQFGKDSYHEAGQMRQWCRENLEAGGWQHSDEGLWIIEQMFGTTFFYFKESRDAVLFSLRWS